MTGTKKSKELEELLSLEHQIGKQVPHVFIWHTLTDRSVPIQNTLMFTEELDFISRKMGSRFVEK